MKKILELFFSMKLALYLLLLMMLFSVIGTVVEQSNEGSYYISKYGKIIGSLILKFRFDSIFSNFYFYLLLFLLSANTLLCSSRSFYFSIRSLCTIFRTENSQKSFIQNVVSEKDYFLHSLGLFLIHIGFILLPLGALVIKNNTEKEFVTARRGKVVYLGIFNKVLKINNFVIERNKNGEISNYVTDLSILDGNGVLETRDTIMVNKPCVRDDIKIYQTSYYVEPERADSVLITLSKNSEQIFRGVIPFEKPYTIVPYKIKIVIDRYLSDFLLDIKTHEAMNRSDRIDNPAFHAILINSDGDTITSGWSFVANRHSHFKVNKLSLKVIDFLPTLDTGLTVKTDVGTMPVMFGFIFMVMGFILLQFYPKQELSDV